jgi:hypothetical protein
MLKKHREPCNLGKREGMKDCNKQTNKHYNTEKIMRTENIAMRSIVFKQHFTI